MMNTLLKTLTKPTTNLHLSPILLTKINPFSTFTPPLSQPNEQVTSPETETPKQWPNFTKIPYQSRVANMVNLIGTVRMPVKFVTSKDGVPWAGTIINQEQWSFSLPFMWVPIVFKGDMAHTAATHLAVDDNVFISGHLNPDPLPINLKNDRVDVQVMVHDVYFVRASQMKNGTFRSKARSGRP